MTQFGDLTKHSRDYTDTLAINFCNDFFPSWEQVDNLGSHGLAIHINSDFVMVSLLDIEKIKEL